MDKKGGRCHHMRYAPIDANLFIENRRRLARLLKPDSLAVFNSNDVMPTSADGVRQFIQHTDLFYLTGVDQEETILIIYPDAVEEKHREVLFIRETNDKIAVWEGQRLSKEDAQSVSGIKTVYWTSEFKSVFKSLAVSAEYICLNTNEHLRADTEAETRDARFIKWCMAAYPLHKYDRLAPRMHHLRAVKSQIEIELIRKACSITESAFRRILGFVKPGVWEFEIEAEIYHEFLKNRSRRPAYQPVIASGPDTCVLHYVKNDKQCQDGDLLLTDFGAEYANYAADLTRTIPVSGQFTKRQKDVYQAVLKVQRAAIQLLKPGNTIEEYHKEVGNIMEEQLIGLGLLNPEEVRKQDQDKPLYKKYFMHGVSHYMGLDVHDLGSKHRKFEAGMVYSCEPGIYIKDESIGVRLENDILITENGPSDLMETIPIEPDHIEELMQTR